MNYCIPSHRDFIQPTLFQMIGRKFREYDKGDRRVRNQTKITLVVSIIVLSLIFGSLLQPWSHHTHQQIEISLPGYEHVGRSIEGKIVQFVMCASDIILATMVTFIAITS